MANRSHFHRHLKNRRHSARKVPPICPLTLRVVSAVALLLVGGLFALGYLVFKGQPAEHSHFDDRRQHNITSNSSRRASSWAQSTCQELLQTTCEVDGFNGTPPLVIIALDGFSGQYLARNLTPSLQKLMTCGAHTEALRPSFPSITFPNFHSIATGLNVESHGIVDNKFFDPDTRRSFHYKEGDAGPLSDPVWWRGEPIWVTAKKQGKRVSTYYWPGNEVLIGGYRADEWFQYNPEDTFDNRLTRVLDRLSRPQATRPDLIMVYIDQPDAIGHIYGVESPEMTAAIQKIDAVIGRFMEGLHSKNLTPCVNLVLLSDHGMENIQCNRAVDLMSALNNTDYYGQQQENNATGDDALITDEDFVLRGHTEGGIDSRLSELPVKVLYDALSCKNGTVHMENSSSAITIPYPFMLYKKEDLPRRLHYTNSRRIEPLILKVKHGYTVFQTYDPTNFCFGGRHGYDPLTAPSMAAVFVGHGPAFKSGLRIDSFSNVELYQLFCDVMHLEPSPNNGTKGALHKILNHPPTLVERDAVKVLYPPILSKALEEVRDQQSDYCLSFCKMITGRVLSADTRLLLSEHEQQILLKQHTDPYGPPRPPDNTSVVVLVNSISAIGFSQTIKLPIWASLVVNNSTLEAANFFDSNVTCARNDARLNSNTTFTCIDFEPDSYQSESDDYAYLVSPDLGKTKTHKTEGAIITNVIPMYYTFRHGIWASFWRMIGRWSNATGEDLHVQFGPVFDHELPYGLLDENYRVMETMRNNNVPLPSHFFVIISQPIRKKDAAQSTNTIAFLLPHRRTKVHACQSDEEYFLDNTATVKDIELVTGLRFFTGFPVYEAIRLRILQPKNLWFP